MLADLIDWSKLELVPAKPPYCGCEGCVFDELDGCEDAIVDMCMAPAVNSIFIKKEQDTGGVKC